MGEKIGAKQLVDEYGDHPRWSAMITCPTCGTHLPIYRHSISADGQVTPSVGHGAINPNCPWHVTPRLLGWAPCPPAPPAHPEHVCARCGAKTRQLGGWGIGEGGLLCPKCMTARAAPPMGY